MFFKDISLNSHCRITITLADTWLWSCSEGLSGYDKVHLKVVFRSGSSMEKEFLQIKLLPGKFQVFMKL